MSSGRNFLQKLNSELEEGWEAKLKPDGRIYYVNHKTHTSSWLPPRENWQESAGLPYGWETALDGNNKPYFINHVDKYTTREDPRQDPDYVEPPRPREVELIRDQEKGFGFVAGSEKPVVVRFVTEGGPSVDKLLPGDLILKIHGEEVRRAPREKVIELVRSCKHSIVLTVCQPYCDNSSRKSAILTAAKKAKLKSNPSRVRFADAIMVNGASVNSQQSPQESYVPFMPNVLKVFLENGQTKSFKYDNKTTVKDVVYSLQEKLNITCTHHFSLVLQNMKSNVPGKMTLLPEHETLAELAARPGARHFRCLFRVAFVPHDAYDLLKEDPIAFEYFYMQCCNDVIHERFASEMKYDTALRLAALQIQQHAMSNNMSGKISIKAIEKESGLDKFVAHSLLENMKSKDLRKMLAQYMKMNQNLTAPGQKQLSALQAKLHYMKIISELKTFGSRVFMVTLLEQKSEAMILVGAKAGISVVTNIKSYTLTQLADFSQIENIKITKDGENMHRVDISIKSSNKIENIALGLLMEDAQNFVSMVVGYYHIFVDRDKRILEKTVGKNTSDPHVPSYESHHRVLPSPWAYPEDLVSEIVEPSHGGSAAEDERIIDLSLEPPQYEKNEEYLAKMKQELNFQGPYTTVDHLDASSGLTGRNSNGQLFEEGVTSFGRTVSSGDDSSSLDSSVSSQGITFRSVIGTAKNSSCSESGTDEAILHPQPQDTLVSLKASPPSSRNNSVLHILEISTSLQDAVSEVDNNNRIPPIEADYNPDISSFSTNSLGHDQNDRLLSDTTSSTSSLSTNEANERQALLGDKQVREEGSSARSLAIKAGAKMNDGLDADSDDTDSMGTPHASPAKSRQLNRTASIELALQSFGLHSPDTGADVDFQNLDENIQLATNGTAEGYKSVYSTQGCVNQGLYYDPDIIDLTNFPPPETPEDDSVLDFTDSNFPPPVFSSNTSLSTWTRNETAVQFTSLPRAASTPSRLERSASTGNCPDFLDDDIDALIAQFIIPPPPSLSGVSTDAHLHNDLRQMKAMGDAALSLSDNNSNMDDLAHLIIPPPPPNIANSSQIDYISVVPPVHDTTTSGQDLEKSSGKLLFRHKRSSSLDVNFLRSSKDQFDSKYRSISMDDNKNVIDAASKKMSSLDVNGGTSGESVNGMLGNSPASVSEKLHSLLQSLPTFVQEDNQMKSNADMVRIGSHHIQRSSSLDVITAQTKQRDPNSIPIFTRSSSLRLRWPPSRPRSQSCEPATSDNFVTRRPDSHILTNLSGTSFKSSSAKDLDKSSNGSESFATMKAKLKDYRDFLLSKSKSSASKTYTASLDSKQSSETGLSHRSNSFSKLLTQFTRKGSKSDDCGVANLASADDNWELKEAKPASSPSLTGELIVEQRGDKRVPVVRDALGLNRPTLRPLSNTLNQTAEEENEQSKNNETDKGNSDNKDYQEQTKARKNGPIKALQPATRVDDNNKMVLSRFLSLEPERSTSYQHPPQMSKDDSLMTPTKEKVKANPYATMKIWRPTSTEVSTTDDSDENVYHSFTNFDALRLNASPQWEIRKERITAAGNDRSSLTSELSDYRSQHGRLDDKHTLGLGQISRGDNTSLALKAGFSSLNGYDELPADYSRDNSPAPIFRRVSFRDEITTGSSQHSEEANSSPTISAENPFLLSTSPSATSSFVNNSSQSLSMKETRHDTSFQVVSDGTTNSVKLVLSHSYSDIDLVGKDIERLLAELKLTMDSLKTSRIEKNKGQMSMCLSELHAQTKLFIREAKLVVSSANNIHEKMVQQLNSAVHTLAHVFLHGQATMLLMTLPDRAKHLGFQIIKAANSFKSTVSAANLAMGKTLNDPNMKYLMRQAQNLATLLASLMSTIKEVQTELS